MIWTIVSFVIGVIIYFIALLIENRFPYIHLIFAFLGLLIAYDSYLTYLSGATSIYTLIFIIGFVIYSIYRFFSVRSKIKRIKVNVLNILNRGDSLENNILELLQIGRVSSQELVNILKILMEKGEIPYINNIDKYYNLTK